MGTCHRFMKTESRYYSYCHDEESCFQIMEQDSITTVQGKRLNKLAYNMDHLIELKQALENDRVQQKVNTN